MTYTDDFYLEEGRVARESAEIVLPRVLDEHVRAGSAIIDIGCGTGEWARFAWKQGWAAIGIDHGVPADDIYFPFYIDMDLTGYIPGCMGYGLAICLEVAEHLPESQAWYLVEALAQAEVVLFSAATPGQPGIGHINCQPHDYWHDLFAARGMTPTHIGPLFAGTAVADFYQRNMYLYERQQ